MSEKPEVSSLIGGSIIAITAGAAIQMLAPTAILYSLLCYGAGIGGIGYYIAKQSPFDKVFRNLNICAGGSYPVKKDKRETDNSTIYTFTLPNGISVSDIEKKQEAIEQAVGGKTRIQYTYKAFEIELLKPITCHTFNYEPIKFNGNVNIYIGKNQRGELLHTDLSSGEPHMLIAGETGSGKSTALRSIITNILLKDNVKLHLIDLKYGAEFQIFQKCRNVISFCKTRVESEKTLNEINTEIERRYTLFYDNDVVSIKEYNNKFGFISGFMDYQAVIIDEFADLQQDKNCMFLLEEISAKARACGIHLIISTQRPDAKVLNGRIKANVTTIIGLKTNNDVNSRIIINENGLEELRGKGHGIYKGGQIKEEIQCPYLSTERARKLLKPTYISKPKLVEKPKSNGTIL